MNAMPYLLLYLHITNLYNRYEGGLYDQAGSTVGGS